MKFLYLCFAISVGLLFSCTSTSTTNSENTEISKVSMKEDLMLTGVWYPTTDSYGSSFVANPHVIVDGVIDVEFEIAQKVGDEWPYIELICESGKESLEGVKSITIEYKCDKTLAIKLSQKDFGSEGDNSYAHYYIDVPPSAKWTTAKVYIEDFEQPSWATSDSKAIGLNLNNIQDIYLVPNASYQIGEKAMLSVRSLVIE